MNWVRGLLAIAVGYLIAAGSSMAVVGALFGPNSPEPDLKKIGLTLAGLALGTMIAGFLCTFIAGSANHPSIYITIGIFIALNGRSLIQGAGIEPDWYKIIGTIVLAIGFMIGASAAAYRLER